MKKSLTLAVTLCICFIVGGCGSAYVTPGRGAMMQEFGATAKDQANSTDGGIRESMDKKPLASFPASIAIVRVQAPYYKSYTSQGWGNGKYCIITTRDIESAAQMQKLASLPQVRGLAPLNRLMLPDVLQSDFELRQAAAKVRADLVLVYTLDTVFNDTSKTTPLTIVTLGATPTKKTRIICTASAVFLDTRSGYVYGSAETSRDKEEIRNAWTTEDEVDRSRREVETKAFGQLVDDLQTAWAGIVQEQSRPPGTASYDTR